MQSRKLAGLVGAVALLIMAHSVQSWPVSSAEVVTPSGSTNAALLIRPRSAWRALEPREVQPLKFSPAPFVVLHHTYIPAFCPSAAECEVSMREMQRMHQQDRGWFDIGYTFVVGGDGAVYEGRGWGRDGAHAPRYNDKSVGIAFVGDFRTSVPSSEMMLAAQNLISVGVREGHIRADYALLGHRQTRDTECPGDALFAEISSWPHFRAEPPADPQDFEAFLAANTTLTPLQ
ncbi:hypothetical protein B566_EDAN013912 [Ephemera danica]|nr:hypothetical protein B566_EDAN013912 [Ephemera danica]